ncbi:uncharacterized protein LOC141911384 isoform X2 [Tubulanus polymorphus]|uniref:uncharacterized protein LOC141911384 isoform X2 n=1 Tax=Tubulanus polymorphus TaxID=672921 RepID=UPI003DA295D0
MNPNIYPQQQQQLQHGAVYPAQYPGYNTNYTDYNAGYPAASYQYPPQQQQVHYYQPPSNNFPNQGFNNNNLPSYQGQQTYAPPVHQQQQQVPFNQNSVAYANYNYSYTSGSVAPPAGQTVAGSVAPPAGQMVPFTTSENYRNNNNMSLTPVASQEIAGQPDLRSAPIAAPPGNNPPRRYRSSSQSGSVDRGKIRKRNLSRNLYSPMSRSSSDVDDSLYSDLSSDSGGRDRSRSRSRGSKKKRRSLSRSSPSSFKRPTSPLKLPSRTTPRLPSPPRWISRRLSRERSPSSGRRNSSPLRRSPLPARGDSPLERFPPRGRSASSPVRAKSPSRRFSISSPRRTLPHVTKFPSSSRGTRASGRSPPTSSRGSPRPPSRGLSPQRGRYPSPSRQRSLDRRLTPPHQRFSSPEPYRRHPSLERVTPEPYRRHPSLERVTPEPYRRHPSFERVTPEPYRRHPSLERVTPEPYRRRPSFERVIPEPYRRHPSLERVTPEPYRRHPSLERVTPEPYRRRPSLERVTPEPHRRRPSLERVTPEPHRRRPSLEPVTLEPHRRRPSLEGVTPEPHRRRPSLEPVTPEPHRRPPSLERVSPEPLDPLPVENAHPESRYSRDQLQSGFDESEPFRGGGGRSPGHSRSSDRHYHTDYQQRPRSSDRNHFSSERESMPRPNFSENTVYEIREYHHGNRDHHDDQRVRGGEDIGGERRDGFQRMFDDRDHPRPGDQRLFNDCEVVCDGFKAERDVEFVRRDESWSVLQADAAVADAAVADAAVADAAVVDAPLTFNEDSRNRVAEERRLRSPIDRKDQDSSWDRPFSPPRDGITPPPEPWQVRHIDNWHGNDDNNTSNNNVDFIDKLSEYSGEIGLYYSPPRRTPPGEESYVRRSGSPAPGEDDFNTLRRKQGEMFDARVIPGKLFVRGLRPDFRGEQLEHAFAKYGPIKEVYVPKNRETNSGNRGFGFVTFENTDDAIGAMKGMHGKELNGLELSVVEASKPRRSDRMDPAGGQTGRGGDNLRGRGGRGRGGAGRDNGGRDSTRYGDRDTRPSRDDDDDQGHRGRYHKRDRSPRDRFFVFSLTDHFHSNAHFSNDNVAPHKPTTDPGFRDDRSPSIPCRDLSPRRHHDLDRDVVHSFNDDPPRFGSAGREARRRSQEFERGGNKDFSRGSRELNEPTRDAEASLNERNDYHPSRDYTARRSSPKRDHGPPGRDHRTSPGSDHKPPDQDYRAPRRDHGPPTRRDHRLPGPDHEPHSRQDYRLPAPDYGPPGRDHRQPGPDHRPPGRDHGPPPGRDHRASPGRDNRQPGPDHRPPPGRDHGPPPGRDHGPPPGRADLHLGNRDREHGGSSRDSYSNNHTPGGVDFNHQKAIDLMLNSLGGAVHSYNDPYMPPPASVANPHRSHSYDRPLTGYIGVQDYGNSAALSTAPPSGDRRDRDRSSERGRRHAAPPQRRREEPLPVRRRSRLPVHHLSRDHQIGRR